jgi:TIR domain
MAMATYVPHYKHDIFVSYAHVDNEPLAGADTRWVTNLITGLKPLLGQKLGRSDAYSLWMDYELRGNEAITPHLLEPLQNAAILLLILSPGYLASDWCRRELSTFVSTIGQEPGRVFIIEREPFERPEGLEDIRGYRFWVKNETTTTRTLGIPKPNYDEFEYYLRLDELARDLSDKLKHLSAQSGRAVVVPPVAHSSSVAVRATVFLAEVTDDLHEVRADVERYLQQQKIRVLPAALYYFASAEELHQAIDTNLRESTLFVQLLSPTMPRRPAGMSTPQVQHAAAQAIPGLPILQWRDRRVDLATCADPVQRAFLDAATVVVTGIEEFKQYILQQLDALEAKKRLEEEKRQHTEAVKRTLQSSSLSADTLVFINTRPEDLNLALEIGKMIQDEGFGFSLPVLEGIPPAEIRQDLEENLLDCDAVIVLYASTTVRWVREQLLYCRRMQGRRERPLKIVAVFSKANNQPLGMSLPNMQVMEFSSLRESNCVPILVQALQP